MVLLEQYIMLREKDSSRIVPVWKNLQILFYFIAAITGIIASYCLSSLSASFGNNCFLYSNVTFFPRNITAPPIDFSVTEWASLSNCLFCQYVPVCSVIFSIVWATFFTMCGKGGKSVHGLTQPWSIVYPALIFNIIFFLIALVAAIRLQDGIYTFCSDFIRNNNVTKCRDIEKYMLVEGITGELTYTYIVTSEVSTWINVITWILGGSLLLLRCLFVADFTLMKISVIAPTPDEEAPKASSETLQEEETNNENYLNVTPSLSAL